MNTAKTNTVSVAIAQPAIRAPPLPPAGAGSVVEDTLWAATAITN